MTSVVVGDFNDAQRPTAHLGARIFLNADLRIPKSHVGNSLQVSATGIEPCPNRVWFARRHNLDFILKDAERNHWHHAYLYVSGE